MYFLNCLSFISGIQLNFCCSSTGLAFSASSYVEEKNITSGISSFHVESIGISARHGAQPVNHRLSTITLPLTSALVHVFPFMSVAVNSGKASPSFSNGVSEALKDIVMELSFVSFSLCSSSSASLILSFGISYLSASSGSGFESVRPIAFVPDGVLTIFILDIRSFDTGISLKKCPSIINIFCFPFPVCALTDKDRNINAVKTKSNRSDLCIFILL